ncbi:hypothetical protein CRP01_07615 [Flavilitoribacter nigricans DSM 23189 = NBRC 102662]|uniref:Uncharacterized protein n=1 Tax=Flavilitoribacter nigricans (strain ATCC 23147 / DSM 23189 / NBRC 102662 / NCIMB 1420 / SS-2) TaxID=1122177 RepID=A0A2D0NFC8_FLAN2|nr:hypothetical protein CRP01_07615 [Flavilitoribacter nigricans DSM 23189 = NBRC 102662]
MNIYESSSWSCKIKNNPQTIGGKKLFSQRYKRYIDRGRPKVEGVADEGGIVTRRPREWESWRQGDREIGRLGEGVTW